MKDSSMMIKEAYSKPMNLFDDDIAPKILPFILETIKKYGKNSFVWMGPNPQVLIMEPEFIKEVLSKNCLYEKARGNPFLALLGQGLVSYEEDKWAKHRKIVNPAFHLEKLKNTHRGTRMFAPFMLACNCSSRNKIKFLGKIFLRQASRRCWKNKRRQGWCNS
ncbi:hypothetical protein P3S67_016755 [Capsicum chacoense]